MKICLKKFISCRVTKREGLVEILEPLNLREAVEGYADWDRDARTLGYINELRDTYVAIKLEGEDVLIDTERGRGRYRVPIPGDIVLVTDPFRDCEPMDILRGNLGRHWFFHEDLLAAQGYKPCRVYERQGMMEYTNFIGTLEEFVSTYWDNFRKILFREGERFEVYQNGMWVPPEIKK